MAQAALNALRPESSPFASDRPSGKTCVVCTQTIFRWEPLKYCRELLWNKNVGEFLIKFEIVPSTKVSLDSTICHHCWHFVTTADKASSIVDENVFMLRARVKRSGGGGEQFNEENGDEAIDGPHSPPAETPPMAKNAPKRETRHSNPTSNGPDSAPSPASRPRAKRTRQSSPASSAKSSSSSQQQLPSLGKCRVVVPGIATKVCGTCGDTFAYETSEQKADFHSHEKTHLRTFRKGAASSNTPQSSQAEGERNRRSAGVAVSKKTPASTSSAGTGKKGRVLRHTPATEEPPSQNGDASSPNPPAAVEVSCNHCPRTFGSNKALSLHYNYVHPNQPKPGGYKCSGCKRVFFSAKGLKVHDIRCSRDLKKKKKKVVVHNGPLSNGVEEVKEKPAASPKLVKCKKCSKIVARTALRAHIRSAHNRKPVRKPVSEVAKAGKPKKSVAKKSKSKQSEKEPEEAVEVDLQPAIIIGDMPLEESADQPSEDSLEVDVDPLFEAETSTINYECHCCGDVFTNSYSLTDHVRRSHGPVDASPSTAANSDVDPPGAFKCNTCENSFQKKSSRDIHASRAHKKACSCCRDLFKTREDESQIPGFCDICNKDVNHRNAHTVWLHEDVRRCYRCNVEFGALETFEYHVAEQCPATENGSEEAEPSEEVDFPEFAEEPATVEVAAVDAPPVSKPSESSGFTCRFCPASFSSEEERLRHMTNSHWSCIKCPEIFADRAEFTEHLKTHVMTS